MLCILDVLESIALHAAKRKSLMTFAHGIEENIEWYISAPKGCKVLTILCINKNSKRFAEEKYTRLHPMNFGLDQEDAVNMENLLDKTINKLKSEVKK